MVDYQTIKIDYSGNKEVLSVDLIDSIEYIILEEPSLLVGQVEKMVVENGKILLCANSNKCIWVFDDKGTMK